LYSLASRWGAGFDFIHHNAVIRTFRGNSLRVEDLSVTPDVVGSYPDIYRRRILTTDLSVVRSFGQVVIQRVTVGHHFDQWRSSALADVAGVPSSPAGAEAFLAEYAPASETRSEPYLRYEMFTPRYREFRDLDTFDLRETRQLGPSIKVEVGLGLPALGASLPYVAMLLTASWAAAPGHDGYGYALAQASARRHSSDFIDQQMRGQVYLALPSVTGVRLVVSAATDAVRADTRRSRFILGGSTGLRGYAIGDFADTTDFIVHVELRTKPLAMASQRLGMLLFYDVGDAAPSFATLVPHHDVGLGLRWLIPQLNSAALRIDWAIATQSTMATRSGLPGRFSAGYAQAF
jgi:hypothetical protein